MHKRYAAIWLPYLLADWYIRKNKNVANQPIAFVLPEKGRMVITAVNSIAEKMGIAPPMVLADAKAALPELHVVNDKVLRSYKLLKAIGIWCLKFTPTVAMDARGGLLLDMSGCSHLWGGEINYIETISVQLHQKGYQTRLSCADTIGAAWAASRYGPDKIIVPDQNQLAMLASLPVEALRLDEDDILRLYKLGFRTVGSVATVSSALLKRRFSAGLLHRLEQFLGKREEHIEPLEGIAPYAERLPCLEPIRTDKGIEVAILKLLEMLCKRLTNEGKGLRKARLSCYRVDGKKVFVEIGTNRASAHVPHLSGLFSQKIAQIEPALGIELFLLEALVVDEAASSQETLWREGLGVSNTAIIELLDRIKGRDRSCLINRYVPDQHHWPERSIKSATSFAEKPSMEWPLDRPRPTRLLHPPQRIEVTAPIPDYPPMLFRYANEVHHIKKADGPERIEREWWLENGEHRDYYYVEDESGNRYWLFRLGHYRGDRTSEWYLHGFFA
ncbi:Y-family DNA polymerase [Sphingobacterium deserti]|uniref:DNA repair nucleotidyltransferase/DNA polymerase n=1 Tax=Sphingobacterium deserti TaxID=1229276 RepID=A0A0B8T0Y1_9SPHI|nr:DNA polymerase Y family protein [Sphingobacterium deserti]KGE12268.1 DNA repair nucleotidyltransferase/DNA polymerase [Sphingobacterium deserti]